MMGQDAACAAALLALCFYVLPADSASCSLQPFTIDEKQHKRARAKPCIDDACKHFLSQ
jgi:hypothetical protein